MREELLEPTSSRNGPLSRLPRLRGGSVYEVYGVVGLITFIFFASSQFIRGVSPLEYGLMKSGLSGQVTDVPVQGGIHFCAPWKNFILFPATYVTMEWSNSYKANRPPVSTRTGADPNDPDSGGQPISISCAVQFKLKPHQLKQIFLSFGSYEAAEQRYLLLAGNQVSNTAQEFTPQDFWQNRHVIARRMLYKINEVLVANGADAVAYEVMKIGFAPLFENSITGVQVAEQQKVVNEYSQQVQTVEQRIAVLNSHNLANIAKINANAVRTAKEMVGNATKHAFIVKQEAKAVMYAKLQQELQLNSAQMGEYIKIRSLMAHSSKGKVVVRVAPPALTTVQVKATGHTKSTPRATGNTKIDEAAAASAAVKDAEEAAEESEKAAAKEEEAAQEAAAKKALEEKAKAQRKTEEEAAGKKALEEKAEAERKIAEGAAAKKAKEARLESERMTGL